ncbi:hypothetical protein F5884DRAFT_4363 [Xylogone sp. PMI_703]|nr:hypothetical protein F5884DRAFT_4363 [Xylogone sp. PMI_703]
MWYVANLYFSEEKLEHFYNIYSQFTGPGSDVGLTLTTTIGYFPQISDTEPSINLLINYAGSEEDALQFANPFLEFSDARVVNASVPYTMVAEVCGTGVNGALCQSAPGLRIQQFLTQVNSTNILIIQTVYNLIRDVVTENLDLVGRAFMIESYG